MAPSTDCPDTSKALAAASRENPIAHTCEILSLTAAPSPPGATTVAVEAGDGDGVAAARQIPHVLSISSHRGHPGVPLVAWLYIGGGAEACGSSTISSSCAVCAAPASAAGTGVAYGTSS